MAGSMVYRLRVSGPDDPHMGLFIRSMSTIQGFVDNRGYNHIAGFHGFPGEYCWHSRFSNRNNWRLFLPWHRAYLWWLEQALQDVNPSTALPWWDWTRDQQIPVAYNSPNIGGNHNPLYDFHMVGLPSEDLDRNTQRSPGSISTLPTKQEIENLLEKDDWNDFSGDLENFHNRVHVWVGGDMGSTTYAAFDPIFYAHHCMVDRIWYLWQIKHSKNPPEGSLNEILMPFNKTVRDVIDVQTLGYEYAATSVAIEV